jgi:phenylalanyl-tRNA synthetase beta subunit
VARFRPAQLAGFVAGTGAEILLTGGSDESAGYLGQLDRQDSPIPLFAAEMRTEPFTPGEVQLAELPSRFPAVAVDLTFTHAETTAWSEIADEVLGLDLQDLADFGLKVRYVGEGVPAGAVNTTLYFLYNADDRSLTQEEVNERHEAVRLRLTERFGWKGSS